MDFKRDRGFADNPLVFGATYRDRFPLWDSNYICLRISRQPRTRAAAVVAMFVVAASAGGCSFANNPAGKPRDSNAGAAITIAPPVYHARLPRTERDRLTGLCRLCDEYDLVEIMSDAEWRSFVRAAGLDPADYAFDFRAGHVVGVVAYVGTPMTPRWPIDLSAVGRNGSTGWVMATLRPTLYHTVAVPGFCTFTYVSGLGHVARVDVTPRSFVLQY